jgi:hypothetical protein
MSSVAIGYPRRTNFEAGIIPDVSPMTPGAPGAPVQSHHQGVVGRRVR